MNPAAASVLPMPIRLLIIAQENPASVITGMENGSPPFAPETAGTAAEALARLEGSLYDVVLAVFPMPDWQSRECVEEIQRLDSRLPVVILDGEATLTDAASLAHLGAFQVVSPATPPGQIAEVLRAAASSRRVRLEAETAMDSVREPWRRLLVGQSRAMESVFEVIRLIGPRRSTVLITGETGTGKEVAARAIHLAGSRSHRPLVAVNCSALPEQLLEAELFGHVKGAFTGAFQNRTGRFEQAHLGTILLDEIGEMPLDLQAKLLRVLQEREFQRLGSSETVRVDVRVLAATNCNLANRVAEGKFREDLYYRLNVVPLSLPPLRERLRDIPLLVHHFIEKICRIEELPLRHAAPETLKRLQRYSWPGNIRQLENAVEMAIALSGDRRTLYPGDFPLAAPSISRPAPARAPFIAVPDEGLDYDETVGRIERAILEQAMCKTGGNKKQAAEMLRLKRTTFAAKLRSLGAAAAGQGLSA